METLLGFLVSFRAPTTDGERVARQLAAVINDSLPVEDIDVVYMGEVEDLAAEEDEDGL